jgi:hypothetical protein
MKKNERENALSSHDQYFTRGGVGGKERENAGVSIEGEL